MDFSEQVRQALYLYKIYYCGTFYHPEKPDLTYHAFFTDGKARPSDAKKIDILLANSGFGFEFEPSEYDIETESVRISVIEKLTDGLTHNEKLIYEFAKNEISYHLKKAGFAARFGKVHESSKFKGHKLFPVVLEVELNEYTRSFYDYRDKFKALTTACLEAFYRCKPYCFFQLDNAIGDKAIIASVYITK